MATIDLGKIKLVWRGTYVGGTDYTVDDVVQYTDGDITSSFICTTNSTGNAPSTGGSVHSSWAYLAKGGTAGTDVGTTITTQGDILYRDGSGLQRLAKGTAGQALKMNTAANAPEWGTISSDWVKLARTDVTAVSEIAFQDVFTADYDIYKVYINNVTHITGNYNLHFRFLTSGSTEDSSSNYNFHGVQSTRKDSDNTRANNVDASTGASTYRLTVWGAQGYNDSQSGMSNWDITLYDPRRNHKHSSAKGGNMISNFSYWYHNTYQVTGQINYWNNDTSNVYQGFKIYPDTGGSGGFQANGTISVYGIKA